MVTAGFWDLFLSCFPRLTFIRLSCLWCLSRWRRSWGDVWQDVYCHQPGKIFCHQRGWWSASGLHHWPPSCKGPPGSKTLGSAMWVTWSCTLFKPRATADRHVRDFSLVGNAGFGFLWNCIPTTNSKVPPTKLRFKKKTKKNKTDIQNNWLNAQTGSLGHHRKHIMLLGQNQNWLLSPDYFFLDFGWIDLYVQGCELDSSTNVLFANNVCVLLKKTHL